MPTEIKLRGKSPRRLSPYPFGDISEALVSQIGKEIVYRLSVGYADIEGNEFARIFSSCIDGRHLGSPLGVADVVWGKCAWSIKTVKADRPFSQKSLRLISGRNSPIFSKGISDHSVDIQKTGKAVLEIWNARIDEALAEYNDLRTLVFVRNMEALEFVLFELETGRYLPQNFEWRYNSKKNLEGYDVDSGVHKFTWQPHGAQFTVLHSIPKTAFKFRISQKIPALKKEEVLNLIDFREDWIEVIPRI